MRYLIVSGGYPPAENMLREQMAKADSVLGVDGAADLFEEKGITADTLIGDFDTADMSNVDAQRKKGAQVINLNTKKNETDTEAAVKLALERGAEEIIMLGAVGTRMDHTLANIALLKQGYDAGADIRILNENNEMFVCRDGCSIKADKGRTVSILPLCGDIRVDASGLEYPLHDLLLAVGSSRGVSNIMKKDTAEIKIKGGYALVILSNDL